MLKSLTSRWTAGAAALCAALLALTWIALVGPKRAEAADLTEQAASTRQSNDAMQIRTSQLKAQFATLPQAQAELGTLATKLPPTADVPHFVRSLDALAAAAGVRIDGVTPAPGESLDAKPGAAGTSVTTPATSAGDSGSLEVIAVPMTITVHGPYFKTVTFLKGLQTGDRAFLVTGLQVTVDNTGVALAIRGRVFAVPGIAAAVAGATGAPATGAPATGPPARDRRRCDDGRHPGSRRNARPHPLPEPVSRQVLPRQRSEAPPQTRRGAVPVATPAPAAPRPAARGFRRPAVLALVSGGTVVLAGLGWMLVRAPGPAPAEPSSVLLRPQASAAASPTPTPSPTPDSTADDPDGVVPGRDPFGGDSAPVDPTTQAPAPARCPAPPPLPAPPRTPRPRPRRGPLRRHRPGRALPASRRPSPSSLPP